MVGEDGASFIASSSYPIIKGRYRPYPWSCVVLLWNVVHGSVLKLVALHSPLDTLPLCLPATPATVHFILTKFMLKFVGAVLPAKLS